MTVEEYYATVRSLGLSPTKVPTVFETAYRELHNVPDPRPFTAEQRREIIERLKELLGVTDN